MFKQFALAALATVAAATAYSGHNGHAEIDSTNSTKEFGLVLWEPFFEAWADDITHPAAS